MANFVELFDEVLSPEHRTKIEGFKCSSEEGVEVFLKEHAERLQLNNMAITRLFFNESGELVGYFTLFNDTVPRIGKNKIQKESWFLPNSEFYPAIRLHYFGVDERYQKGGIGHTMLNAVFDICYDISGYTGCTFISVEALNSAIGFYKHYDFRVIGRQSDYYNMVFKLEELEEVEDE